MTEFLFVEKNPTNKEVVDIFFEFG